MGFYIYQRSNWPNFEWNSQELISLLGEARNLQGRLIGKMETLGFELRDEAVLETLTLDVLKSSEIEGVKYSPESVRSSVAERLGLENAGSDSIDRSADGMVEMMVDAARNCFQKLDKERLFGWHSALFPTGRSGIFKIQVGEWRKDVKGRMQVVSGAAGKEKIHFEAPENEIIEKEMNQFLKWFNEEQELDLVLKSAIAHLWFVTIHPFQDGNGRITRAITDMLLAQSDKTNLRFYSMSAQIRIERKGYYDLLEKTQKGDLDITAWLKWFLNCLINSLKATDKLLAKVLSKADFWNQHAKTSMNQRQKKVLNKLLDGLEGKLTSQKWAKLTSSSKETAVRDINDLISKDVLSKEKAGGRSTSYVING